MSSVADSPRDPQIRVTCTEALERELLEALDRAKNARSRPAIGVLTDLAVAVVQARRAARNPS